MLALAILWVSVFYPHASQLWQSDRPLLLRQMGQFSFMAGAVIVPTIPVAFAVGPSALGLLFGHAFRQGGTTFGLLVSFAAIALVNANIGNVMLASHDDRAFMATVSLAALVNIGLNVALIPVWGPAGSAAASVGAEVVSLVCGYARVVHVVGRIPPPPLRKVTGCLMSLILACAVLWLVSPISWILGASVCFCVYYGTAYLCDVISPSDFRTQP